MELTNARIDDSFAKAGLLVNIQKDDYVSTTLHYSKAVFVWIENCLLL